MLPSIIKWSLEVGAKPSSVRKSLPQAVCPEACYLELPECEIAYLQIIAHKLKHLSLSLSIWNLCGTTASFLSSAYSLLLSTGSYPSLLLKDDGSEILKVNFVCATVWSVHNNVIYFYYYYNVRKAWTFSVSTITTSCFYSRCMNRDLQQKSLFINQIE